MLNSTVRRAGALSLVAAAAVAFPGSAWANPAPGMEVVDETSSCTAGFAAQGGAGAYYLLTSGHCESGDGSAWTDADENPLGTVIASEDNGDDRDAAAILLAPGVGVPSGAVGGRRVRDALAPDQIGVGMTMCKIGARTGETCGDITAVHGHLVEAKVLSTEGDSGSPGFVVNPDGTVSAVGILTGGPDNDDSMSYFVMVSPLLARWQLRLLG